MCVLFCFFPKIAQMKRTISKSKRAVCGTVYCKYGGINSSQTNRRLQLLISCRLVWIKMIWDVQVGWLHLTGRSLMDSTAGVVIRECGVHIPDLSIRSCMRLHLELGHWLMLFYTNTKASGLISLPNWHRGSRSVQKLTHVKPPEDKKMIKSF